MPEVSFGGLLVVAVIAVSAPLLVGLVPAIRVPAVVLEILAGIAVGPSGLGWVEVDLPIQILALMGLAFLLFLAGLQIDLGRLRGPRLRTAGLGYLLTLALGVGVGLLLERAGFVSSALLIAIALSATALGLVVPVLDEAGEVDSEIGRLTVAGSTIADFGAIVALSLFFSRNGGSPSVRLVLIAGFAVLVAVSVLALCELSHWMRLSAVVDRLQDTAAEIRVRFAVLLLVAFVALAERVGLATVLGAFLAGAVLNVADRDTMTHPTFSLKLEAIGNGFVIPVFFVASGLRFDLQSLMDTPSALARVPLFLLALLVVRGLPALVYAPTIGRRAAAAAGLLQATSLPFLVGASQIGVALDLIRPVNAAALVSAGLLSVVLFPLTALKLLRRGGGLLPAPEAGAAEG